MASSLTGAGASIAAPQTITQGGLDAIAGGTLVVGNDLGGANADNLVLGGSEQISPDAIVSIKSSGAWNLISNNESLGNLSTQTPLVLNTGLGYSALVTGLALQWRQDGQIPVPATAWYHTARADLRGLFGLGASTSLVCPVCGELWCGA